MEKLKPEFLINIIFALLSELETLKAENAAIREQKADLEAMIEMTSEHADEMESDLLDKVDASIKEIEERVRMISETIPVPVIIARRSDGKIMYVNEHSCRVFKFAGETFLNHKTFDLYETPSDRISFLKLLSEQGAVNDFEVRLKKSDGTPFWAVLFSQPLNFRSQPCVLTVVYDLTERKQAEEQIRRLTEELEREKEREEKYLIFRLADQEYGVPILKIREIIGITPITPVPNTPHSLKGVINLRGRVMQVTDLRSRLGVEAADYTDRTCIIVADVERETMEDRIGFIVDSVSEVLSIKGKYIEPPPEFGPKVDVHFISGMAKTGERVKILLHMDRL